MTVLSSYPNAVSTTPDAGMRSLDHYKQKLPHWRYVMRQRCLPLIRWETPHLAWIQRCLRTPALDSYFALTANLGTHTFFMIALPILFWCGYTSLGRGMVHILASGVFFSGFIKDLLCLPRPLSPPLQRITMSGSAALEYGFPSTHSTNAVSVVVYAVLALGSPDSTVNPQTSTMLKGLAYFYAVSIVLGRIYCGMHGFTDVIVGSLLGAMIAWVQWSFGDTIDNFLYSGSYLGPLLVIVVIIFLVRIHPEPADDCPCFDDSVAFAGVMIGCELGNWHYAGTGWAWNHPVPATVPFMIEDIGWIKAVIRVALGVLIIVAWREVMKPSLLKGLPPVFRVIEKLGLDLPRRYFMTASEYGKIPSSLKVDNVIPSVSELPNLIKAIRNPRRRAVSIGPQSAADAYETIAHRERQRSESISSITSNSSAKYQNIINGSQSVSAVKTESSGFIKASELSKDYVSTSVAPPMTILLPRIGSLEKLNSHSSALYTPMTPLDDPNNPFDTVAKAEEMRKEDEKHEREIFSRIEKPRVRYDVEVVTKLIVYSGIALLAVEGNPLVFEIVGLGMPRPLR